MRRRKIILSHRRQRAVLTDMLPFEVPPTFSNKGFFRFLIEHEIVIVDNFLQWTEGEKDISQVIRLIFGIPGSIVIESKIFAEWGRSGVRRLVALKSCKMGTIPFEFRVSHKSDGRLLCVVHPRNQIELANFYADNSSVITYYTSISSFSIRKPVAVARFTYFKDRLHEEKVEKAKWGIEESDKEYEQLGSYFVYKKYSNIHRFFESYKYHRSEKKYDYMAQIDVNKCFDSIYTHSISWAVLGKQQTKFDLAKSKDTFAGKFDRVMQNLNYSETNGIVIGPEFSRIFAEIILQSVDHEVLANLAKHTDLRHKIDYEIFRYVDDYFVFYNDESKFEAIKGQLAKSLKEKKLSFNTAKEKIYRKPIITEITIAKEEIATLLNFEIAPHIATVGEPLTDAEPLTELKCKITALLLIPKYKAKISQCNVEYSDLLNFTFAILENKLETIAKEFAKSTRNSKNLKTAVKASLELMEFCFFAYSASPKVNHTVRICRMICIVVDFLHANEASEELKHSVFKFIHDSVFQQLEKNTMSRHREVESLYLLTTLIQIGQDYLLPESLLVKHFRIDCDENSQNYNRDTFLNHFSITVLLTYMKSHPRYRKLREFVEVHTIQKLQYAQRNAKIDTEALLLLLDLGSCPYVQHKVKIEMAKCFDITSAQLDEICSCNRQWFTVWGDKFNLLKELDAKRMREVY